MSGQKPQFAPSPNRAFADKRLSGLHHRVLQFIAAHDRFGANGQPCFASQTKIARWVDASRESVSRALGELEAWGYITKEARAVRQERRKSYRVAYTDEDEAVFKGEHVSAQGVKTANGGVSNSSHPPVSDVSSSSHKRDHAKHHKKFRINGQPGGCQNQVRSCQQEEASRRSPSQTGRRWWHTELPVAERLRRLRTDLRNGAMDADETWRAWTWLRKAPEGDPDSEIEADTPEYWMAADIFLEVCEALGVDHEGAPDGEVMA